MPKITIRTTVITGFPGETKEDFAQLCAYIKEEKFQHLGAFAYSREEGTPAAEFEDQIDEQIKQDRMDLLMKEQMLINEEQNRELIGKTITVLVEGYDVVSETQYGRSAADAPEIDGKVYFKSDVRIAPGSFARVKIREVVDYDLYGRAILKETDAN
jgi:ribosomal protein S12 methylthiotransferase